MDPLEKYKHGCSDYDDTCGGVTKVREDLLMLLCDEHYKHRINSAERRRRRLNE